MVEYLGRYTHKIAINNGESEKLMIKQSLSITKITVKKASKADGFKPRRVYPPFCDAYFAEKICKIRHYGFEQHLETIKKLQQN